MTDVRPNALCDPGMVLPRAPSQQAWARMTPAQRLRAIDALPSEFATWLYMPGGDPHFNTKVQVRTTLEQHFGRVGRRVRVACGLPVYYPDEPVFAPDVMVVVDVDMQDRLRWVVSAEGRGPDLVLEILVDEQRRDELEQNVERYARLGIREYFVFDRTRQQLSGHRLGEGRRYQAIVPQYGRYHSDVLGLDIRREEHRLRFYVGTASVPTSAELVGTLEQMLEGLEERTRRAEAERGETEKNLLEQVKAEAARAEAEAAARAGAEARLAEALAEIERLRRRL